MTSLEVRGLEKLYGETRALVGLDMQCQSGTVHTVFGENGSGKSTLVKILSGIVTPTRGEVFIEGQRVREFSPRAMRRSGVVSVLQEVLVAPNRPVIENIFLGYDNLFTRRIGLRERLELAKEVLAQITHTPIDLDSITGSIPLPQQQIVVIARALVYEPHILILDEATAALDISDREKLFAAVRKLVEKGTLVIFISHRIDEVMELSDTITVLRGGKEVTTVSTTGLTATRLLNLVLPEGVHIDV